MSNSSESTYFKGLYFRVCFEGILVIFVLTFTNVSISTILMLLRTLY